jgi:hypothetical protein
MASERQAARNQWQIYVDRALPGNASDAYKWLKGGCLLISGDEQLRPDKLLLASRAQFAKVWQASEAPLLSAPEIREAPFCALDPTTPVLLRAGDERSHGTVPAAIGRAPAPTADVPHRLTLTKRGNYPLPAVLTELTPYAYTAVKPLALSTGFDVADRCHLAPIGAAFLAATSSGIAAFDRNPGSSDATIITSSMLPAHREFLLPLVYGPGTRSQRRATPPRLTHGPNETFIKAAGTQSLAVLLDVLTRAGHIA